MRVLVYDCEIVNAIPGKGPRESGIEYCEGWRDFDNMGISCVGAWCSKHGPRVFLQDNSAELQRAFDEADVLVSFNGLAFDNPLLAANGISIGNPERCYDLLAEIWRADGLAPEYQGGSHAGYGLDACALANFGRGKTGNGALAPVLWQRGNRGAVIDYCLRDVELTRLLFTLADSGEGLVHPKKPGEILSLRPPQS